MSHMQIIIVLIVVILLLIAWLLMLRGDLNRCKREARYWRGCVSAERNKQFNPIPQPSEFY